MNIEVVLLIITVVLLVVVYGRVTNIRRKSLEIVSKGNTDYHFEIVNGPSGEDLLTKSQYEWDRNFGFEISSDIEPERQHQAHNLKRKSISYFIVPDRIDWFYDADNPSRLFYPISYKKEGSESATQEIDRFLVSDKRTLKMIGSISKAEPRGNVYSYFGGGICFSYGRTYRLTIVYDLNTQTGKMIIREED